jgi:hypothetical protein
LKACEILKRFNELPTKVSVQVGIVDADKMVELREGHGDAKS